MSRQLISKNSLISAVSNRNITEVKKLIEHVDINYMNSSQETALSRACMYTSDEEHKMNGAQIEIILELLGHRDIDINSIGMTCDDTVAHIVFIVVRNILVYGDKNMILVLDILLKNKRFNVNTEMNGLSLLRYVCRFWDFVGDCVDNKLLILDMLFSRKDLESTEHVISEFMYRSYYDANMLENNINFFRILSKNKKYLNSNIDTTCSNHTMFNELLLHYKHVGNSNAKMSCFRLMMDMINDNDFDVNKKNDCNMSYLFIASDYGLLDIVNMLLSRYDIIID